MAGVAGNKRGFYEIETTSIIPVSLTGAQRESVGGITDGRRERELREQERAVLSACIMLR